MNLSPSPTAPVDAPATLPVTAPMVDPHAAAEAFLASGAILLGAALLFVLIFRRIGLGAVLGYLLGGVVIGPQGLGLVSNAEAILSFSEIGIVMLLFLVGLELSPKRLWRLRRDIFGLGPLQVVLCGLAMYGVVLMVLPFTWQAALVIGLSLGLSSTAQVLPLLQSGGRLRTDYGEKSLSVLLFQDLSIVPLLTIVAALSRAPTDVAHALGWELAGYALLAIFGLVLAGRYLLSPILALIGNVAERELFVVAGLFTVFGSALLMQSIGLSPALGGFIAGVILAESPYRHELEADVDPFRSILLGLFFLAVGMLLDLEVVAARPFTIIGLAVALIAIKVVIMFGLARLFGLARHSAVVMALLLSQGGEFGFVLFSASQRALLIEQEAASLFGAVITLSMAATPFLMLVARRLAQRTSMVDVGLIDPEEAETGSVIVVGNGRFGQTASQIVQGAGHQVTLIDINPDQIDRSSQFGRKVYFGDGTRLDLLRRAGAEEASAILFCMDDPDFDKAGLEPVVEAFPRAKIFVRAFDRRQLLAFQTCTRVQAVRELFESAVVMGADVLKALSTPADRVERIVAEYRERDDMRLAAQFEEDDLSAGSEHSFGAPNSRQFDQ